MASSTLPELIFCTLIRSPSTPSLRAMALVLTAIVISLGMTAVIVLMSLGAWLTAGDDRTDMTDGTDT